MLEKYEICCGLFHGFDWSNWISGTPEERLGLLPSVQEHILSQEEGRDRLLRAVKVLSQAFALSVPHEDALRIRDDVSFFQAVRASLAKRVSSNGKTEEELDLAVRQIVSRAVVSEGVIDIFTAAGLEKPDISILSDEFLAEVKGMPQRNLAVELLRKLLSGEIRTRRRKKFSFRIFRFVLIFFDILRCLLVTKLSRVVSNLKETFDKNERSYYIRNNELKEEI